MEAGDQLRFGFRNVERRPVGLRHGGDEENEERDLSNDRIKDEPPGENSVPQSLLSRRDPPQTQRAVKHQDRHHGENARNLIGHQLRGPAKTPQHRKFVSRSPSRHEDADRGNA